MTVVLVGVGADQTNSSPYPRVYEDNTFEYIPIPEAQGSTETQTFGSIRRKSSDGQLVRANESEETLADALEHIAPEESECDNISGPDLTSHPIHWDPNFAELTYGEVKTQNKNQITRLNPDEGDVLAFYTGLATPSSGTPHRYIIGYFTVAEITDFSSLIGSEPPTNEDGRVVVSELPQQTRDVVEEKLARDSENAHVKRYEESGTIHPDLLIASGKPPGGLLDSAYRISQTVPGGHAFSETAEEQLQVASTASGRDTGFLGGFKKTHRLGLSGQAFIDAVTE